MQLAVLSGAFKKKKKYKVFQDEVAGGVLLMIPDSTGGVGWEMEGTGFLRNAAKAPCSLAPDKAHLGSISAILEEVCGQQPHF